MTHVFHNPSIPFGAEETHASLLVMNKFTSPFVLAVLYEFRDVVASNAQNVFRDFNHGHVDVTNLNHMFLVLYQKLKLLETIRISTNFTSKSCHECSHKSS
jgi:hypothetical protein